MVRRLSIRCPATEAWEPGDGYDVQIKRLSISNLKDENTVLVKFHHALHSCPSSFRVLGSHHEASHLVVELLFSVGSFRSSYAMRETGGWERG